MTLCVGRRWLLRIWQRLAGLLKQYVHHKGLVLCGEMERLRHPLAVRVQQNNSSKTTSGISGWLSLVLGEHSHLHKDKEFLQKYVVLRKKKSRAAPSRRYSFIFSLTTDFHS